MNDKVEKMAFSVDEAAMRASLGRDRIYNAIRDGDLVARKFGRRTLITADALRRLPRWLAAVAAALRVEGPYAVDDLDTKQNGHRQAATRRRPMQSKSRWTEYTRIRV